MGRCECGSYATNIDPEDKVCDVCFYKIPLQELLAVIHRDGGHYTADHGIKKASKDAYKILYKLMGRAND